uniref:Uncharacterized protein n=1 Tax=Anguilla anguilla TaxID=7936 RepID=A0A0E9XLU5_ANGAN
MFSECFPERKLVWLFPLSLLMLFKNRQTHIPQPAEAESLILATYCDVIND